MFACDGPQLGWIMRPLGSMRVDTFATSAPSLSEGLRESEILVLAKVELSDDPDRAVRHAALTLMSQIAPKGDAACAAGPGLRKSLPRFRSSVRSFRMPSGSLLEIWTQASEPGH